MCVLLTLRFLGGEIGTLGTLCAANTHKSTYIKAEIVEECGHGVERHGPTPCLGDRATVLSEMRGENAGVKNRQVILHGALTPVGVWARSRENRQQTTQLR